PGLPERVVAAHPVPADEAVLDGAVQRVAHVELAGDVRRRDADHVRLGATRARAGPVEAVFLPDALPALLDAVRVVPRLHARSHNGRRRGAYASMRPGESGSQSRNPPSKAFAFVPSRESGGSSSSFPALPPPRTT